jgi:hypothetical protein
MVGTEKSANRIEISEFKAGLDLSGICYAIRSTTSSRVKEKPSTILSDEGFYIIMEPTPARRNHYVGTISELPVE